MKHFPKLFAIAILLVAVLLFWNDYQPDSLGHSIGAMLQLICLILAPLMCLFSQACLLKFGIDLYSSRTLCGYHPTDLRLNILKLALVPAGIATLVMLSHLSQFGGTEQWDRMVMAGATWELAHQALKAILWALSPVAGFVVLAGFVYLTDFHFRGTVAPNMLK